MAKSQERENIYLTPEIIETIEKMGSIYFEYQSQAFTVADELNESIDKYLKANGLWENQSAIFNIIHSLPPIYPRHRLYDALYAIQKKGEELKASVQENNLSSKLLDEIKTMGRIYTESSEQAAKIESELGKIINKYMTEQGLWKNQEAIREVIECLPGGYLRFNFYETYYDLEKAKKADIKEEN